MTDTVTTYEGWAILELMGHRQRVGMIREVEMFGGKLLRIDIPTESGDVTEFYGCSSIYAMRPLVEELARDYAKRYGDPRPVRPIEYRLEHRNSPIDETDRDED
jgi:hypothetical protein